MATWAEFAAAAPEIASEGKRLIHAMGGGKGHARHGTRRRSRRGSTRSPSRSSASGCTHSSSPGRPRSSTSSSTAGTPCTPTSTKRPRPSSPLRGRARLVDAPDERERVATGWKFEVDDSYALFEFSIDTALLGARPTADDWPPIYSSWRATG